MTRPNDSPTTRPPLLDRLSGAVRHIHRKFLKTGPFGFSLYVVIYCLLGGLSFSTAYVQVNTATVWLPTGFAIGLLLARGSDLWPVVALGSFLVNFAVNTVAQYGASLEAELLLAFVVAIGNTLEAVTGAALTRRFAGGEEFLGNPRALITFATVVAPLAAIISTAVGVTASWLGGLTTIDNLFEAVLTWYIANTVGILMFTGPTILALRGLLSRPPRERLVEAALLLACLAFVSQAVSGIYFAEFLAGWPKAYMVIPLLLWASYRFGLQGALFATIFIVVIATFGTMRGFQVFPAATPSRSLLYLQIFLAMLALMALSIAATRAQVVQLQATLESRVRDRTAEVERLLKEKQVFTTVVAHDLQSPLYGVRNALRSAAEAVAQGRITLPEVMAAMRVMEETCTTLAARVAVLLTPEPEHDSPALAADAVRIANLVSNIAAAHRLAIDRKAVTITFTGDKTLAVHRPAEIEHILDVLIENGIRYSPQGSTIDVAAFQHGGTLEIQVTDNGGGVAPDDVPHLFLRRPGTADQDDRPRHGLGLHLASELASGLAGRLSYSQVQPSGSRFRLILPARIIRAGVAFREASNLAP